MLAGLRVYVCLWASFSASSSLSEDFALLIGSNTTVIGIIGVVKDDFRLEHCFSDGLQEFLAVQSFQEGVRPDLLAEPVADGGDQDRLQFGG